MENSVRGKDMETTRDKVIRMILEEMDSKIEASEIQDDTNLFEDLEIDSIAALDIVSKVEEEWGIRLTDYPELLDEMETVSSFVMFLENLCGGDCFYVISAKVYNGLETFTYTYTFKGLGNAKFELQGEPEVTK